MGISRYIGVDSSWVVGDCTGMFRQIGVEGFG